MPRDQRADAVLEIVEPRIRAFLDAAPHHNFRRPFILGVTGLQGIVSSDSKLQTTSNMQRFWQVSFSIHSCPTSS